MDKAQILQDIETTKEAQLNTIASFKQEDFNTVPFANSWTAGKVTDHITKAVSGIKDIAHWPVTPTDRDPAKNIQGLKDLFLDMDIKMQSPDFVLPSEGPHDRDAFIQQLEGVWNGAADAVKTIDLSPEFREFELPGFGHLTLLENIYFAMYHSQRHIQQLQNIHKAIYGN